MMKPASFVTNSVKHEAWADAHYAPPALGIGIGVTVIIVCTFGTGAVVVGAAFAIGGGISAIGKLIDKFMAPTGHKIEKGADTVRTNLLPSALAHDKCKLDQDGKKVITGAHHCFIEEGNASRVDDLTDCPGKIVEGSKAPNQLQIGGPTVTSQRPLWYTLYMGTDLAYGIAGLSSSLYRIAGAYDAGLAAYDAFGLADNATDLFTGEKILDSTLKDYVDGGRSINDAAGALGTLNDLRGK